jgi:hypothetical protein
MELVLSVQHGTDEIGKKMHPANQSLLEENVILKMRISELEEKLKKYTNGTNHKRYYEKNKEKIKESGSSYLQKLKKENPEKIKEYSRRAYANKKKKMSENTIIANNAEENNNDTLSLQRIVDQQSLATF